MKKLLVATTIAILTTVSAVAKVYEADVPENITTPDVVQTKTLGKLNFEKGYPAPETVDKVYDHLFVTRGMTAFLDGIPTASMEALNVGYNSAGVKDHDFSITETRLDAATLMLTANTTVIYSFSPMQLEDDEPLVLEVPSGVLGILNDAKFEYVADFGNAGADKGKGGKYLIISDDYQGEIPKGYHVVKMSTKSGMIIIRGFVKDDDEKGAANHIKSGLSLYKLSEATNPPKEVFTNLSSVQFNTIHASNIDIFKELNNVIQNEDAGALGDSLTGDLAAIGVEKGKEFNPNARQKALLKEAAALGNASVRAIAFSPKDETIYKYGMHKSQWYFPFAHKEADFKVNGTLYKNDRSMFHYMATFITPAMVNKGNVGKGSDYVVTSKDDDGMYLSGNKVYTITLPAGVPTENFWSFMVYDSQTRSMLETEQRASGIDGNKKDLKYEEDGSLTLTFSAEPPNGDTSNWVQTVKGKSFFVMFRNYSPGQAWFDNSWQLGEFKKIE